MPTLAELTERLRHLHQARFDLGQHKAQWNGLLDNLKAEFAELLALIDAKGQDVTETEQQVRETALALYVADPSMGKKGLPGVTIQDGREVTWEENEALDWAKAHRVALALDRVTYKTLVIAGEAPGTVTPVQKVAIATDLGKVLGNEVPF